MQANKVPVCTIGLLNSTSDLWMDSIEGLHKKYPVLTTPHNNAFYMILCIEEGEGTLVIDQDKVCLTSSQVLIFKPNCINTILLNEEAKGTIIGFTADFFSLRYNTNVLNQFSYFTEVNYAVFTLPEEKMKSMSFLLWQMLEEARMKKKASQKMLR